MIIEVTYDTVTGTRLRGIRSGASTKRSRSHGRDLPKRRGEFQERVGHLALSGLSPWDPGTKERKATTSSAESTQTEQKQKVCKPGL